MRTVSAVMMAALVGAAQASAATLRCAVDSVKVGNTCVDKYEASVWQIAPSNTSLVRKVQSGKATLADLTAGGAVQLGCTAAPYGHAAYPLNFPTTGQWTPVLGSSPPSPGVYAASVPGVLPTTCTTWFQAAQACALSGKRLITNREWQDGAAGTPDGTPCVVSATGPANTGANAGCESSWGASDMVGNVWEWVADWVDFSDGCTTWPAGFGTDLSCFGGPGSAFSNFPAGLVRGGHWSDGTAAGVFAVNGDTLPTGPDSRLGFRCAR